MNDLNQKARELRKNMTPQERKLWNILKNRQFYGYRFRRQFPIERYIVDFVCREKKIIVELDGGQHNQLDEIQYDIERTSFLTSEGYQVIRFWNSDIDRNLLGVYKKLQEVLADNKKN